MKEQSNKELVEALEKIIKLQLYLGYAHMSTTNIAQQALANYKEAQPHTIGGSVFGREQSIVDNTEVEKMAEDYSKKYTTDINDQYYIELGFIEGHQANNKLDKAIAHYEKLSVEGGNQAYVVAKYLTELKNK